MTAIRVQRSISSQVDAHLEEPLGITRFPLGQLIVGAASTTTAHITESSQRRSANGAAPLNTERFPSLQFTFQAECLFTLFAQLSLGATGLQLRL